MITNTLSCYTTIEQTPISCVCVASPGLKTKRDGVKSGRAGAFNPSKLYLSCNANKCSEDGTGDLAVLTTHETSPIKNTNKKTRLIGGSTRHAN